MRRNRTDPTSGVKICHLTTVHVWDDTRIFQKQCVSLAAAGFDVSLVASGANPSVQRGVTVIPCKNYKRRLARMTLGTLSALVQGLAARAAIFHYHDPELIPAGILLRLLGKVVIYDVHEDAPRHAKEKQYIPAFWRGLAGGVVEFMDYLAGVSASAVVAVTPGIGSRFPPGKTRVIQNYAIPSELQDPDAPAYKTRPAEVIYVGAMGQTRGIGQMVEAVDRLPKNLGARLHLVGALDPGSFSPDVRARLQASTRTVFSGYSDRRKVARLLGRARIGVLVYHPSANNINGQPNKLFEYMSAGLPVIGSDFPHWREIIRGVDCGLVVDPLDVKALAEAIQYLLTHEVEAEEMGLRGRRAVAERFSWKGEEKRLIEMYKSLSPVRA